MAKFNPPENFCFERPADWADWKKRFGRYRIATKLDKEDGCVQVSTLIYALGPEAENIFSSFALAQGEETKYDAVMGKFDAYFIPKRNVIQERACFYQRTQRTGERAETFIRALYDLSEHCDFGAQREEHIRDRIVVGIQDKELSRKLQLIPNLTIEMTVQEVHQMEDVKAQVNMQDPEDSRLQTNMDLFFSGAVTSSPSKRRVLRADRSCQSLDLTLLSPDSSYICYSSVNNGDPCCCRRSPRLLTNGYYLVTEDSFSWDDDGNVSLTPCKTNVSYKENLVRVFRRRRRPRSSLARLLSNVTESCQSWLDRKVFRGVFRTSEVQDQDQDWIGTNQDDEPSWAGVSGSFTYDHTELPPPPDKQAPPPKIIQEDICSEICQSKEELTQSLSGLSEVPPPTVFYTDSCCYPATPELTGLAMMKVLLLFTFTTFILATLYSRCLMWGASVASTVFIIITAFMYVMKSGPVDDWRKAKTEDITSRNE